MSSPLKLYKSIVDALALLGKGVYSNWVMEKGTWPDLPQNKVINVFLSKLDKNDKKVLVLLLEQARDGGIHDTLALLNDRMILEGLRFVEKGIEMPLQPFDTDLYYDWHCRKEGDPWPDEDSA
jgi:hypothetical protein